MKEVSIVRGGVTLAVIAAICTALVAATYLQTRDRIEANEQAWLERSLQPALSGLFFDSNVTESRLIIPPPHGLPGSEAALVYRVFAEGAPVAALFVVTARGYSGPIRVLIGITVDGAVTGVRVLEHRETPGLGDKVEASRSDWVKQFDGRSMGDPAVDGWAIKRDGGDFDQLTGASVTPRGIVNAIRETLLYFAANQEQLFVTTQTQPEDAL